MVYRPRIAVALAASAVAMQARCRQLGRDSVDELQQLADQLLGRDDPLFRAVNAFATDYLEIHGNPDRLDLRARRLEDDAQASHGCA